MKKTIVYIDAFNLYYGLLKGTANKWLDPVVFSKTLLADDHEIVGVKYFTSQIKPEPDDPDASLRQMVYLNALSTLSEVSVIKGFYKRRVVDLPLANEPCRTCKRIAAVVITEEKRSDVNLAVELVKDASASAADCYVVVSGDSDLAAAVQYVRYTARRPVLVYNPQTHVCVELKRFASYYRNIARDVPARCQLPIEVKDGIRTIHCPEVWRCDKQAPKTERLRCPKTPVADQIRLELALASLFMESSCEDEYILELLRQRELLRDGTLTAEGKSAALRVMRKYGILTRLASVGHGQPKKTSDGQAPLVD